MVWLCWVCLPPEHFQATWRTNIAILHGGVSYVFAQEIKLWFLIDIAQIMTSLGSVERPPSATSKLDFCWIYLNQIAIINSCNMKTRFYVPDMRYKIEIRQNVSQTPLIFWPASIHVDLMLFSWKMSLIPSLRRPAQIIRHLTPTLVGSWSIVDNIGRWQIHFGEMNCQDKMYLC